MKTFITSGVVIVGDPCYDDSLSRLTVKPGEWVGDVENMKREKGRIGCVSATHADHVNDSFRCLDLAEFSVGVDSGQAGIFDSNYYRNDKSVDGIESNFRKGYKDVGPGEDWYSVCCDKTLSDEGWGIVPNGVVSSSGWGDGSYNCYTEKDKDGKIIHIEIRFEEDEEDNEDDFEEDERLCDECGRVEVSYEGDICQQCNDDIEEGED